MFLYRYAIEHVLSIAISISPGRHVIWVDQTETELRFYLYFLFDSYFVNFESAVDPERNGGEQWFLVSESTSDSYPR